MQKIWLLAFSFLIFLFSTSLMLDLLSFTPLSGAFAQALSPTPAPQVNYELPYPGLLPDSPLYFLRIIRDKTIDFLISDPLRKAEFDLLQADKRLNAGIYLFNSAKQNDKKMKLGLSTVSKAENYFEEALDKVGEAKMQGRNIDEVKGKLRNAVKKHQQELEYLTQKVSANFKQGFENELKRITGFDGRLNH
jgi:hypothetical protein